MHVSALSSFRNPIRNGDDDLDSGCPVGPHSATQFLALRSHRAARRSWWSDGQSAYDLVGTVDVQLGETTLDCCNGSRSFPPPMSNSRPGQSALFSPSRMKLQTGPEESRPRQSARRSEALTPRTGLRGSRRGRRARELLGRNAVRSPVKIVTRYNLQIQDNAFSWTTIWRYGFRRYPHLASYASQIEHK